MFLFICGNLSALIITKYILYNISTTYNNIDCLSSHADSGVQEEDNCRTEKHLQFTVHMGFCQGLKKVLFGCLGQVGFLTGQSSNFILTCLIGMAQATLITKYK